MATENELTLSTRLSCYRVNKDGSFTQTEDLRPSVYIKDTDANALFNKDFTNYVLDKYGPIIGVVHHRVRNVTPAPQRTLMRILG